MLILLFLIAAISFVLLLTLRYNKNEPVRPLPGPKGLPLIGNLHQIDFSAPHVSFIRLAKIYGPILGLQFGQKRVVVVQSAKTAEEVLKTQDLNFCSRKTTVGLRRLSYNGLDIAFCPYNEYFREVKKIAIVHLLSVKRTQSFAPIRQEEIRRLIRKISSMSSALKTVNLSELLMSYSCSNICRIAFGKRYEDDEGGTRSRFHSLLNEAQALFIAFFFSDYFPSLGWLDWLTGQSSRLEKTFKDLDEFYEEIINDHLDPNKPDSSQEDLVDVLLQLRKERSFAFELSLDHIKAILMNIFIGGTDTSTAVVIWAMTELIKNPKAMKKVQEELRNAVVNKGYMDEEDLEKLVYFKAVVKETFRLHPVIPLLVGHETIRKTTLEGYDILPNTLVYVNVYAIGRDTESWENPEEFIPERFLESSVDFKGQHFELIPFGAGRRMCPALPLGMANVGITLANLLCSFDWELPEGVRKEDIDTVTLPGVTMHKKNPLCLVARKFLGGSHLRL